MTSSGFHVTGYDPYEWFFASRYRQGGRTVYAIDFSVREVITFIPKPDVDRPLTVDSAQRRIYPTHAKAFADYVLREEHWVSPALLLRGPSIFKWEIAPLGVETGTTQFGQLGIPKDARSEIQIVDGQHRTLGFHLAWESLAEKIGKARSHLAAARESSEPVLVQDAEKGLSILEQQRDRLAAERVSVQIIVIEKTSDAKRIFVDINDNAKGITGSVKARFDDRKVLTRALNQVLEGNTFLDGLVDLEQDRVSGSSAYLLGAKHVADILRALQVGNGRIGKVVEQQLNEDEMAKEFDAFSEALVEAFPVLAELENGDVTAPDLREQSLVGSNVMLRSFAAAWWELKQAGWTAAQIGEAFATFEPHMGPVFNDPRDTWFKTGVFQPGQGKSTTSPSARAQDFRTLTKFIVDACREAPVWCRATAPAQ